MKIILFYTLDKKYRQYIVSLTINISFYAYVSYLVKNKINVILTVILYYPIHTCYY